MQKKFPIFLRTLTACVAVLFFPCVVHAQWSGFLRLDKVPGESQDTNHLNWIDVTAFDPANIINTNAVSGAKSSTGSAQPLSISKNLDASSTMLAFYCAKQNVIQTGTLDLTTNSATGPLLRLELTNINVSLVAQSSGDPISESVQLQAQITAWYYTQFNTNSGLPHYISSRWDNAFSTGLTGVDGPMTMTAGIYIANGVQLQWNAVSGQSYRIFAVPALGAPFTFVSLQAATNSGVMTFDLPATNSAMFYVVEHLP